MDASDSLQLSCDASDKNVKCSANLRKNLKSMGRWTKEEHKKFVEGIRLYGKNWKKVEDHIGSRSGAQIRSHAQKFFNRLEKELDKKKHSFSESEDSSKENLNQHQISSLHTNQILGEQRGLLKESEIGVNLFITNPQDGCNLNAKAAPTITLTKDCKPNLQCESEGLNKAISQVSNNCQENCSVNEEANNNLQIENPFIQFILSKINQQILNSIEVPKLYELCEHGNQIIESKQQKQRPRLQSFTLVQEQDVEKNLKVQNLRRKLSLDCDLQKKIKATSDYC